MPVQKTPTGYRWGKTGKVYPSRAQAEKQGRAIMMENRGGKGKKKPGKKYGK